MKKQRDTDWLIFFDRRAKNSSDPITSADWSRVGFKNRHRLVEDVLKASNKQTGYRLLDCGCGVGHYLHTALDLGAHPVGLDFSGNMLRRAKQKGFLCARGHIENIPFKAHSFEVVLSIGILQHLSGADSCIDQMARILSRKGILILVTLSKKSLAVLYRQFSTYLLKSHHVCEGFI